MGDKTAVVIDHHPLWARALADLLATLGVRVLGVATSYLEGAALVREHAPDLVLWEFGYDDEGAAALVAVAHQANANVKCISVGDESALPHLEQAFAAGAAACCLRSAHADDFATAIRQMFVRSIYFAESSDVAARRRVDDRMTTPLSRREKQVLCLVARGLTNANVARELWVTEQTIKFHLSNVYRKLGVANRTEASRWAQQHGLTAAPGSDGNESPNYWEVEVPATAHLRADATDAGGSDPLLSAA